MIVRERKKEFVMIEQHNHAQLSGMILSNWKSTLFQGESYRKSVELANYLHDIGWKEFDQQPFWNDKVQAPYTFSDFPIHPKIVLYQHGINEVEKRDLYAALLCSEHYKRFLIQHTSIEAQSFVNEENRRQQCIRHRLENVDKDLFDFHYRLLQFGDNLSLYLCLNEPGVTNQDIHPFFKNGIPLPEGITTNSHLELTWTDENTVSLQDFPFEQPFTVTIKQKIVNKDEIAKKGLIQAYQEEAMEEFPVQLIPYN
ncbi:Protein of unknown function [Oceanobacillus limi]|uniref:DUF3891 family protein n=2 Tax=Oceanobacillus limi TaxID=930131 RepID=A0A1I0B5M5_9BACI|nr:Protein of unknown function [Oceanobacillus limi]